MMMACAAQREAIAAGGPAEEAWVSVEGRSFEAEAVPGKQWGEDSSGIENCLPGQGQGGLRIEGRAPTWSSGCRESA
ncbi:MAG: hypothetical protein A2991_01410 [Candidatus Terrybacteria bacterium RIFCSPLOWO2_01_FULL_58_14]|uniref:Uncharacterized protein n=1 Tax=Candidatus Terrybacteria bacterium RIFCSPLOWO2_01_FULL_58_14 TaxID=1802369 RepID=A0A1G2PY00_9BACT|nr:MAG: hypothetical protein A2991_01410 [Candidatus Terrybacteria bacterium RIFCSPLOWO2_01_FULL_58_14]